MADEILENGAPEQTPEPTQTPQLSAIEQRAMEQGWVPQDEWQGDPDEWRPAREFVDRGELFKRMDELKRENKNLRTSMQEFGKHHAEVKKLAFKEALNALRAEKKAALEAGDADAVIEIDDRIAETREQAKAVEATPVPAVEQPAEPNQEFVRWQARNQWYHTDRAMKLYADDIAMQVYNRGITDPATILSEVDKQIRAKFKTEFENPNRGKAGAVEGAGRPSRSTKDDGIVMSDAEKRIMNKIVATGAISKEKYLEEYKARKGG